MSLATKVSLAAYGLYVVLIALLINDTINVLARLGSNETMREYSPLGLEVMMSSGTFYGVAVFAVAALMVAHFLAAYAREWTLVTGMIITTTLLTVLTDQSTAQMLEGWRSLLVASVSACLGYYVWWRVGRRY